MSFRFGSLIQFDASKIDKTQLRQWLVAGAKLLEPAIITPGNIDQFLFDQLDGLVSTDHRQHQHPGRCHDRRHRWSHADGRRVASEHAGGQPVPSPASRRCRMPVVSSCVRIPG